MFKTEEIMDIYLNSRSINEQMLDYVRKCRIGLLKVTVLNLILNFADNSLISEANQKMSLYTKELKEDKYYLKQFKKIIYKLYINGINSFDYDFGALIECIGIKDKSIGNYTKYYVKKIQSQANDRGYPYIKEEEKIDEYNNKMDTLLLKLQNNTLDNNK